jgi:hypothetical protein
MSAQNTETSPLTPSQSSITSANTFFTSSPPTIPSTSSVNPQTPDNSPAEFDRQYPFIKYIHGIDSTFTCFLEHQLRYILQIPFVPHRSRIHCFTISAFMKPWYEVSEAAVDEKARGFWNGALQNQNRAWEIGIQYLVDLVKLDRAVKYQQWKEWSK